MVGLVIVSHSAPLAGGVAELAREMGGDVAIEAAGGTDDGELGTDAVRVHAAIEKVRSPDGVLVLMDLGSALMSAEMATEMAGSEGGPIILSEAPLVEGAVAAAARAQGGASLEEVAREARGALAMKAGQLGEDEEAPSAPPGGEREDEAAPGASPGGETRELRLRVRNELGLHARPAARFVGALSGIDASVEVTNQSRSRGPADGRSLTGLATLAVRQGDEILVHARGVEAAAALAALEALAAENFGDATESPGRRSTERAPATAPDDTPPRAGAGLHGVAASAGIAIGPARRLRSPEPPVEEEAGGEPAEERERLEKARAEVRAELDDARATVLARGAEAEAEIFTAHALLLDDDAIVAPALRMIDEGAAAGHAWRAAGREAADAFRALDEPYLRERAVDVEDVSHRVLARLAGVSSAATLTAPGIVVADELTPRETAGLDAADAWAIATARGGATGHAAILARALGIPAVVGLGGSLLAIKDGTPLVVDGEAGVVEVAPEAQRIIEYDRRRVAAKAHHDATLAAAAQPGALADGRRVEVAANVGSAAEARRAVQYGAEAVGLLRTEFLFLDRADPPGEDEQVEVLREIAAVLEGRPMVVRTLDAGADKPLPFLDQQAEDNPFLGRRGIRLALANPDLFATQLRAIMRVAAQHPLKVMFPMVATLEELRAARALLDEARERVGGGAELEVGVMVEVPALALQAELFAHEVDFFSIGTNDLAQYVMAADRGNAALADLLSASLTPVLALIAAVTAAAAAHGRWVGVCGELAGDPEAAVLLAGLGVGELSMASTRIPAVKAALREIDFEAAQAAAQRVLS